MTNDKQAEEAKRRIEQRLKERREDLERRLPGITALALAFKEVFGPVRVVEKLEPGVTVFPLLADDVRSHFKWRKGKRKNG